MRKKHYIIIHFKVLFVFHTYYPEWRICKKIARKLHEIDVEIEFCKIQHVLRKII